MSENKRKTGKKTTAFLALAAALLASNAVSVMAAAEETSGSDFVQNPDLTDVKYTGGTPAYTKINDNVFVATRQAKALKEYYDALNEVKDFGLYARTASINHIEGNACFGSTGAVNQDYNRVHSMQTIKSGRYVVYLDSAEDLGDAVLKMSNLPSGTKYELVLGFDYTPITFNNNVGFEVGGKRYYIEGSEHKKADFTLRRAQADESSFDISANLDKLGTTGVKLMDSVGKVENGDVVSTFRDASEAIRTGKVSAGETMILNIDANEFDHNQNELPRAVTELLNLNSGVDVVINVDTSNYSGSKLQIRNINNEQFKTGSNVVWNFGDYAGEL